MDVIESATYQLWVNLIVESQQVVENQQGYEARWRFSGQLFPRASVAGRVGQRICDESAGSAVFRSDEVGIGEWKSVGPRCCESVDRPPLETVGRRRSSWGARMARVRREAKGGD